MSKRLKVKNIQDYDGKLKKLKKFLGNLKDPLPFMDIAKRTNIDAKELSVIVYAELKKAHKKTRMDGDASKDFILYGDTIEEVNKNYWYQLTLQVVLRRANMINKLTGVK